VNGQHWRISSLSTSPSAPPSDPSPPLSCVRPSYPRALSISMLNFFTQNSPAVRLRVAPTFPTTQHQTQPPTPALSHDRQQRPALGYHDGSEEALMQVVSAPSAELERRR